MPAKPLRKSIYEVSSDDENQNDDCNRLPSDDDDSQDSRNKTAFSLSKDKDMRIPIFEDYTNGDIDLRLPFKPVMANYIPATEIDAAITSHAPITYEVGFSFPLVLLKFSSTAQILTLVIFLFS